MATFRNCIVIWVCATICVIEQIAAQTEYQKKALNLHNEYRTKHKVSALELDDTLNTNAVKCAEYYAKKKNIDHSCTFKGTAGENLSGGQGPWTDVEYAGVATKMWYDEVKDYDYKKATFSGNTGHFTQCVWKGSKKMGFGYAKIDGYTAAVALYDPAGNMMGDFKNNVLST